MESSFSSKSLGQIAYEAYCESSKGKSLITGARLPTFKDQRKEVKEAWEAAALAIKNELNSRTNTSTS